MADANYGVYVSIRNQDGALWSSNRSEWAEVAADVEAAFGSGAFEALVASIKKPFASVAPAPVLSVVPQVTEQVSDEPVDEAAIMAEAERILNAPQPTEPVVQMTQQFEACDICGGPKDAWRPPGVSKNGKKYPGFFGCGNFQNHPKNN